MATAAHDMAETPAPTIAALHARIDEILDRVKKVSHAETDVLTIKELAIAAKVSESKLFELLPKLPVSYSLGDRMPRVIWGDFLDYLRAGRLQ